MPQERGLPRPEQIKLIVSDVDGTLLDSEHVVHPRTVRAVQKLRRTHPDLPFCISSGKQYNSCLHLRGPDILNLNVDMPALHCHGCIVYGEGGRLVSMAHLAPETVMRLLDAFSDPATAPGAIFLFTEAEVHLVSSDENDWLTLAKRYDVGVRDARDAATRESLLEKVKSGEVKIVKVTLGTDPDHAPAIGERLESLHRQGQPRDFGATRAVSFIIEVAPAGVNKGTALRKLCDSLSISVDNVLAFGDGDNDVEMLETAGFSVAMSNGMPTALEAAKYHTLSNDEGGVGAFLERVYGLGDSNKL